MTRPKEFDRHAAVEAAKDVFWRQGYHATTTEDLRRAMKVGRQSFYDTFVGKREAFVEALQRYNDEVGNEYAALIDSVKSPFAALERMVLATAEDGPQKRALGCLGVAAVSELGVSDDEVATLHAASKLRLETMLEVLVRDAKAAGEVRPNADERAVARQIHAVIVGMKVLAKGGASPAVLKEIGTSTLAGIAKRKN